MCMGGMLTYVRPFASEIHRFTAFARAVVDLQEGHVCNPAYRMTLITRILRTGGAVYDRWKALMRDTSGKYLRRLPEMPYVSGATCVARGITKMM